MNVNGRAGGSVKARRAGGIAPAYSVVHCVLLLLLVLPCSSMAQSGGGDAKLKGRVFSTTVRKRNAGPVTVIVQFDYSGSKLVEGVIDLALMPPNAQPGALPLYSYIGPEVALTTGTQSFRVMLPSMPQTADGQVMARLTLRTKEGPLDLGVSQISAPDLWTRTFVMAVVEPMAGANPDKGLMQTAQSLRFERFDPDKGNPNVRRVGTAASYMPVEETPQHPLAWCSYDLVVLPGPALALMRERQLDALRRWVEGGGSLCVGIDSGLKDYHRKFLNGLAAGAGPVVVDKPDGGLAPAPGVRDYAMLRPGVGRAVVLLNPPGPEKDGELREWREIAAFAWRVRKEHLAGALDTGLLPLRPPPQPSVANRPSWEERPTIGGLGPVTPDSLQPFITSMLPQTTRLVPFKLVICLLAAFLLIVGPVDYYLLGWMKKRRFTWVTLPLACVGFTVLMVLLANYYMGRNDYHSALTIIDVGADNRPVRRSRIEIAFSGSTTRVRQPVESALFTAVSKPEMLACQGRVPAAYEVHQFLRQWEPQANRTMTFDVPTLAHRVNWAAFVPQEYESATRTDLGLVRARAELSNKLGGEATVICGGEVMGHSYESLLLTVGSYYYDVGLGGRRELHPITGPGRPVRVAGGIVGQTIAPGLSAYEIYARQQAHGPLPYSQPPRAWSNGLFDFASRLSPSNSPVFEDLLLADPSDSDEWIVCVVFKVSDGYVVYRKVYRTQ